MRCVAGHKMPQDAQRCPQCGAAPAVGAGRRRLFDLLLAFGLVAALGIVFMIDRAVSQTADVPERTKLERIEKGAAPPAALRIGVTPVEYDDIGRILDELGEGYHYSNLPMEDLLEPARLAKFDVAFLTCGGAPSRWLGQRAGPGSRGVDNYVIKPKIIKDLRYSLRKFVSDGGTIYASDLQIKFVGIAFHELFDSALDVEGTEQTVTAEVLDPDLQRALGKTVDLKFNKRGWHPAAFKGADVTTLLQGEYKTKSGQLKKAPLLVRFPHEKGQVIFTSFHNSEQHSKIESELLRYLVFATMTARLDDDVKRTMVRGGFSPVQRNLLSASRQEQAVTQTYDCKGGASLQFVLGFEDRGAELRLTVVSPGGRKYEQTGRRTIVIDVPQAAAGEWKYTVTPVSVPFQNFPFTLTVGERK